VLYSLIHITTKFLNTDDGIITIEIQLKEVNDHSQLLFSVEDNIPIILKRLTMLQHDSDGSGLTISKNLCWLIRGAIC